MNTYTHELQQNKRHEVAHTASEEREVARPSFRFVDNRPEAIVQRKVMRMVKKKSQTNPFRALQEMTRHSVNAKQVAQLRSYVVQRGQMELAAVDDYFQKNGGISVIWRNTYIVQVKDQHGLLSISYNTKTRIPSIGEITRPKNVIFHASDMIKYALEKIEKENGVGTVDVKQIGGSGIINSGTKVFTNFPGAKLLSTIVPGNISSWLASKTPLGKMLIHFLNEYYPDMELKSVVLQEGPQSTAANALVNIGAVSEWTRFCEKCVDDRVFW